MAVEDHVVFVFAELVEPAEERSEAEAAALLAEFYAFEGDDLVEVRVVLDGLGVVVADHPVDFGSGVALFECGEDGGRTADVAEGAGADDEDAVGIWHLGG